MEKSVQTEKPRDFSERGKPAEPSSQWYMTLALSSLAFVLFLPGCAGVNHELTAGIDPLLGGPAVRPSAQTQPQAIAAVTPVPAPPLANSTLSNAALAATSPQAPNTGHDLRIGTPSRNPNDGWAGQQPGASSKGSGVVLREPEPATPAAPRTDETPAYSPVSLSEAKITSYEQAQAQLAARGVLWQKLEMAGEKNAEWKFTCAVPKRQNPKVRRVHVAQAPDALAAIRAVLGQIDKDQ